MPQIPIKTWFLSKYEKFVVSTLIVALFTTQVFSFPVAQAIDLIPDFIDGGAGDPINELVTIVVDQDLDNDNNKYPGLTGNAYKEYLGTQSVSLGHRVTRYANDIKDENPGTDVKILFYDKQKDSVPNLANALENMYINGEGSRNNRLSGVVLVGDIPLPVVNKEGNRFVSMYPYTDFYNKAYIYNPETLAFERNAASSFPQPEVWHGVINGTKSELAEYFDKNHLYYEGVNEYAKFEKRMFFGDLIHEEEMTNKDVYTLNWDAGSQIPFSNNICNSISNGESLLCSGKNGYSSLEIIVSLLISSKSKRKIDLPINRRMYKIHSK